MPKVSKIKIGGRFRGMFVGKSGSRKTTALSHFPKPMYIFDFDGRLDPIALHLPKEQQEEIEYDTYKVGDIKRAQDKMKSILNRCEYRTVAFDSLTSIGDVSIYESRSSRGFAEGKVRAGVMMADPDDYNMESSFMMAIIDFMKKVDCHTILTAHLLKIEENDVESKVIGKKRVAYSLVTAGKKVSAKLPGYFNEVYYFQKEAGFDAGDEIVKVFTRAINIGDGAVEAKSALPIPPVIDWTNKNFYDELINHVKAHGANLEVPEPEPDPTKDLPVIEGF